MKINKYKSEAEWLDGRLGLISGSKLHDVYSKGNTKKIGFYQLIADRLCVDDGSIDGRERGKELEQEGLDKLSEQTGIKFIHSDLEIWVSDESPSIAFSPDGYNEDMTVSAEIKNLGSARHLQITIENKMPIEYYEQCIQAFIVNPKLERHFFASYDKRLTAHPLHVIELVRENVEKDIQLYLDYEIETLKQVDYWTERLAF